MEISKLTLLQRVQWAQVNLKPVEPKYCIIYEDKIDEPLAVCTPSQRWLAMALHGNLLPPVWVYHAMKEDTDAMKTTLNRHLQDETPPIGPMTEEEAMEYLLQKDVPIHVWLNQDETNRQKFKIVSREQVPSDRTFRNAWSLTDG